MYTATDALTAARHVAEAQLDLLAQATAQVVCRRPQPIDEVILSGAGEFLGRRVVARLMAHCPSPQRSPQRGEGVINPLLRQVRVISLAEKIGCGPSRCAPAHALAVLAREEVRP